jgi:hypothetical protein
MTEQAENPGFGESAFSGYGFRSVNQGPNMASTGYRHVFELDTETIDRVVTQTSPGAYVLTRKGYDGKTFRINYVGRSDSDLNARLKAHASAGKYSHFKCGYNSSPMAAFHKECALFHDWGELSLDNGAHPARPKGSSWTCKSCDIFD